MSDEQSNEPGQGKRDEARDVDPGSHCCTLMRAEQRHTASCGPIAASPVRQVAGNLLLSFCQALLSTGLR
jgi:hypothetical protein